MHNRRNGWESIWSLRVWCGGAQKIILPLLDTSGWLP